MNPQATTVKPHPGWAAVQRPQGLLSQAWSTISPTPSNFEKLKLLCHSEKELKKEGYVLQELNEKELSSKMRCTVCHVKRKGKANVSITKPADPPATKKPRYCKYGAILKPVPRPQPERVVCFWHPGQVVKHYKYWSCCKQHVSERGCEGATSHKFGDMESSFLLSWRYHRSDPLLFLNLDVDNSSHRAAVALDCEMGMSVSGESDLIRLTAVDFFTSETLVDNLVFPTAKMAHLNTRYSGVSRQQMTTAVAKRTCFFGRDAARQALFKYVGLETVLIMHGGSSDLTALRLLHPHVVDSFILEGYHGVQVVGGRSLKNLVKIATGRDIQRGNAGHDSLEDALATRELVIRLLWTIPDA